jgi:hypothetical protein
MKEIPLRNRQGVIVAFTQVDDDMYDYLMQWRWQLHSNRYAARAIGPRESRRALLLHRVVADVPDSHDVDHINHNKLDNQRGNLRIATRQQNMQNRPKYKHNASSQYKGVSFDRQRNRWRASIRVNKKAVSLGSHQTEIAAALAYNHAATRYFGDYANLNLLP